MLSNGSGFSPTKGFESLDKSGADLSNYQNQLSKDRISRTLTLRRSNKITISAFTHKKTYIGDLNNPLPPALDPSIASQILGSNNEAKIIEYCGSLMNSCTGKTSIAPILSSSEVASEFVNILNSSDTFSLNLIIAIIQVMTTLFPLLEQSMMTVYVDEGIVMCLLTFLAVDESSPPNTNLIHHALKFTAVMASSSNYARDALFSFGIHSMIITLASTFGNYPEIQDAACEALYNLFSSQEPPDTTFINDCVCPIAQLLTLLRSKTAISFVLNVFVEMSNKLPSIVFSLFDMNMSPVIVQLLNDDDLTGVALSLIGNMTVAQPFHINKLLENGLFDHLLRLLNSEHTADVLWVLSNLLESVTDSTLRLINTDFVVQVVTIAMSANFNIEKEAAYFLSTFILFSGQKSIENFVEHPEIVELLTEMLGCGSENIILRCMDAIIRFVQYSIIEPAKSSMIRQVIVESEARDRLLELTDGNTPNLKERASYLLNVIDKLDY
ncbi:hypothetical protein TRFO_34920 [Tritrichomonas foetus]|uniref:Armadillo/beta-catenin-like repeat family protein n=1 Tax=Tritrichomonas foetus TaxID=1144522 RepID=A0A1J4JJ73_9EUKA|nr:hypothetical protein TRFO_34920 [Tritrichomonas foetus]|eukprot:OHS98641.1 hypothetical protein TRFO_34920 [Tritrichomonas foetus]